MRASVTLICDVLGVNRSSYKYWVKRPNIPSLKRIKLPSEVRSAHEDSNGSAGPRPIATIDTDRGIQFSRYCATRLMKELELVGCQLPSHRYRKADQEHIAVPNKLDRALAASYPNQVWCGEVTCIWSGQRWAYLAVVIDLYGRKPIGWAMSLSPDSVLTGQTLSMAYEVKGRPKGVMFHSDQGGHYSSRKFRQHLWRY
jgi:putative transposase